jgi:hypothetical protein
VNIQLQKPTMLYRIFFLYKYFPQRILQLIERHVGQESKMSGIDAKDGNVQFANASSSAQERAIASYAKRHIGLLWFSDFDIRQLTYQLPHLLHHLGACVISE